jgi:hypothetical protein
MRRTFDDIPGSKNAKARAAFSGGPRFGKQEKQ